VEPRNLMNRPGLRCPVSLPIPISTIGVNCIGRVIHSSAHAALHDIMFRDRICAIYPFEYEKKRVWNKDGRGYAYVDAGFAISIPKHVDAAEASTLLQIYTPAFQSIQLGITHKDPSNVDRRYTKTLLDDQTILIQHGSTETGLALIELALGLGADQVYATASCVHHSLIEGVGATPLSLVEKKQAKAWELWKTLQDGKISLIIMQEMPSMLELDKFMSVLSDNGSIVFMGDVGNEAEENSPSARNIELKQSDPSDLFDVVEKARIAHEKAALVHRLQTCPEISTYKGVMSNIIDDSLAWKDDVSFLFSLLAQGRIHPRVHERIYSLEDVSKVQDRLELYGKKESVVCLPLKKRFKNSFPKASTRVIIGNCSLRTKVEAHAVTQIASTWRKFACQRAYRCTIEGKIHL
jgi:NADPH:quinone reductase-like Zn-dependent oxidoreductase